jgi:hypothetical protein
VGTALLSTIFASAAASYASAHVRAAGLAGVASVHGYTVAFDWAAGLFAAGLLVALFVLPNGRAAAARARSTQPDMAVSLEAA